jgi:hypothetical protein
MSALDIGLISGGVVAVGITLVSFRAWQARRAWRSQSLGYRRHRVGQAQRAYEADEYDQEDADLAAESPSVPPSQRPATPDTPPAPIPPRPPSLPPAEELPAASGTPGLGAWHIEIPRHVYEPAPAPAPPDHRYANASLADPASGEQWPRSRAIEPGDLLRLRLDIGPLSATSQVAEPVPFPDEYLPAGDLVISVVVNSSAFTVGRDQRVFPAAHSAEDSFVLPGDGAAARAPDGTSDLTFVLGAPAEPGPASVRVSYYYRDAVLQSQLLSAQVGGEPTASGNDGTSDNDNRWSLVTDYTVAAVLATAAAIPDRRRVAVILNGDDAGHQIYVRTRGADTKPPDTAAASLPAAIGTAVKQYRRALADPPVAPTTMSRTRPQLETVLRMLAPLGWNMYTAVFPGLGDVLLSLSDDDTGSVVLHVARPTGVTLSVPWALLYTIPLYETAANKLRVCPLVAKWDGRSELVVGQPTSCPQSATVPHDKDLLCPFGFLGFRSDIEQLSSTKDPVLSIKTPPGSQAVLAETTYKVDVKALETHITTIRGAISRLPDVSAELASGADKLKELISRDLPLVYFYCHGERPNAASAETYLGIGNNEIVRPSDFTGWIVEAYKSSHLRVWDKIRPLVFINACHSAEVSPEALFNYIDVFVGSGNAAGVIGTEVKVSQDLAMTFAEKFFDQLLSPGATVATALRHARLEFLAKGNLFGLNYTPYCWADLTVGS